MAKGKNVHKIISFSKNKRKAEIVAKRHGLLFTRHVHRRPKDGKYVWVDPNNSDRVEVYDLS